MTDTVKSSPSHVMVKPMNSRKAKSNQNAIERWAHLEQNRSRIRERLLFVNRFENFRLERHQKELKSTEADALRDIFRAKDHIKLSLIDIAKSKRHIKNNVCDFERKIRRGASTPVFSSERDRLKQKERDLRGLQTRLQGPNSHLLAEHVQDELKMIEYRNSNGAHNLQTAKALPSIGEHVNQTSVSFESEKLKNVAGEQDPSLPGSHSMQLEPQRIKETIKLAQAVTDSYVSKESGESKTETNTRKKDRRHTVPHHPAIESSTSIRVKRDLNQETINSDSHPLSPVPEERLKGPLPNLEESMPLPALGDRKFLLSTSHEQPSSEDATNDHQHDEDPSAEITSMVHFPPVKNLPPKKSKTSKCRTKMQRQLLKDTKVPDAVPAADIMITRRERHAQKRLAEVRMKAIEEVNRVTASGSIPPTSQRHEMALSQRNEDSRSRGMMEYSASVGISIGYHRSKRKHGRHVIEQELTSDGGIRLPPIRVDPLLLQELKRQRVKHRMQSTKLPKLP